MVLGQCFVEREHATSDNVGEHLLPEPVDTGESVCNGLISGGFTDLSILLLWGEADGIELCLRDGVYSDVGMMSAPYSTEGATSIKNTLEGIFGQTGGADSIVALYMVPSVMLSNNNLSTPYTTTKAISRPTSVGTKTPFTPKNKKLLTFPYTYLCVDTLDQSQVYKYERFVNSGNNVGFKITGTYLNNPTFACAPMDYEFSGVNHTNQVLMAGYPMCIINVNTYKQWISNNWAHVLTGMASSVGSIALGAASGSITGSVVGMIGLGKNIADLALESNRVNTARGSFTSSINAQARTKDIYFKRMTILYERAKSIDEFFDRYGYACERVKTPNIHARQNWTYTKTRGCVVKGKLPASSARKIADIFDKGITFWVSAVGNYSISNPTL